MCAALRLSLPTERDGRGVRRSLSESEPTGAPDTYKRPVSRDFVGQPAGCEVLGQAIECLVRNVTEEPVVHLQTRGPATVGQAFRFFEREHSVSGSRSGPHPEMLLGMLQQLVRARNMHAMFVQIDTR